MQCWGKQHLGNCMLSGMHHSLLNLHTIGSAASYMQTHHHLAASPMGGVADHQPAFSFELTSFFACRLAGRVDSAATFWVFLAQLRRLLRQELT